MVPLASTMVVAPSVSTSLARSAYGDPAVLGDERTGIQNRIFQSPAGKQQADVVITSLVGRRPWFVVNGGPFERACLPRRLLERGLTAGSSWIIHGTQTTCGGLCRRNIRFCLHPATPEILRIGQMSNFNQKASSASITDRIRCSVSPTSIATPFRFRNGESTMIG